MGRGGFGEVFAIDNWIDPNGKRHSVALKIPQHRPGAEDVIEKEITSLSKLNHLFVVKHLGLAEMERSYGRRLKIYFYYYYLFHKLYIRLKSTVIVMELCEGDLKHTS